MTFQNSRYYFVFYCFFAVSNRITTRCKSSRRRREIINNPNLIQNSANYGIIGKQRIRNKKDKNRLGFANQQDEHLYHDK